MGKLVLGFLVGVVSASVAFLVLGEGHESALSNVTSDAPQREDSNPPPLIIEEIAEAEQGMTQEPDSVSNADAVPSAFPPYDPEGPTRNPDGSFNAPRMPALPGTPGFEVMLPLPRPPEPVEQLAAETRDLDWANGMEARILAELPGATTAPMNQVIVECRQTWCGVVVDVPSTVDTSTQRQILAHLKSTMSFSETDTAMWGRRDGSSYITYYLKSDR